MLLCVVMLLNFTSTGKGSTVVLLHGIAGSSRYWQDVTSLLAHNHRVISIDLLGFGRSPHPHADYNYPAHIQSIKETLDAIGIKKPFVLTGHSMGALLALRFAATYPEVVKNLHLFNPPVFMTPSEARQDIIAGKKLFKYIYYGPSSWLLCTVWCRGLRPFSKHIAPLYLRDLPHHVGMDSVLHSWQAFSSSLHHIIENQDVQNDLLQLQIPVTLTYSTKERVVVIKNIHLLRKRLKTKNNITFKKMTGPHHLPLAYPEKVANIIVSRRPAKKQAPKGLL